MRPSRSERNHPGLSSGARSCSSSRTGPVSFAPSARADTGLVHGAQVTRSNRVEQDKLILRLSAAFVAPGPRLQTHSPHARTLSIEGLYRANAAQHEYRPGLVGRGLTSSTGTCRTGSPRPLGARFRCATHAGCRPALVASRRHTPCPAALHQFASS